MTALARPGGANAVAVEVFGPEPHDLAIMWVDWNPTPRRQEHGPVGRRVPHRQRPARAAQPARRHASSTCRRWRRARAHGHRRRSGTRPTAPVTGIVRGAIEAIQFAKRVTLGPARADARALHARTTSRRSRSRSRGCGGRTGMGAPNLYTLALDVDVGGRGLRPPATSRFGIQQMTLRADARGPPRSSRSTASRS